MPQRPDLENKTAHLSAEAINAGVLLIDPGNQIRAQLVYPRTLLTWFSEPITIHKHDSRTRFTTWPESFTHARL